VIAKNLAVSRKRDQNYDFKLSVLVYYNEEIDEEERERRWGTLYPSSANSGIDYCNSWVDIPWPESYHADEGLLCYTVEEYESCRANWPIAEEAIKDIPKNHLERRRLEAQSYWLQQKQVWRQNLEKDLLAFKAQKERFGQHSIAKLRRLKGLINQQ
jgi:hypothetical protein